MNRRNGISQVQLTLFPDRALITDPQRLIAPTHDAFDELERDAGGGQDALQRRA